MVSITKMLGKEVVKRLLLKVFIIFIMEKDTQILIWMFIQKKIERNINQITAAQIMDEPK